MEFKIDTNSNYVQITLVADVLDAKLTEALGQKQTELAKNGAENFLIDLSACTNADKSSLPELVHMHADCYSNGQSLVFIGIKESVMQLLKETGTDLAINIAPTHIEAVDIISMEILERDLFNEE